MSGNIADVCPVGALNHGPTAFGSRPYELLSKSSIDLMDSIGSNT
jgi:NADH-quinone oxidoreductase subunit G